MSTTLAPLVWQHSARLIFCPRAKLVLRNTRPTELPVLANLNSQANKADDHLLTPVEMHSLCEFASLDLQHLDQLQKQSRRNQTARTSEVSL